MIAERINVDMFAGGGGASSGIEEGGLPIHIAINHDRNAVEMHKVNHPETQHFCADVFEVEPRVVLQDRGIGLLWASPDCTYHSKARGSKPFRSEAKKRRGLAWVICRWTGLPEEQRPEVVMLENVEEFAKWGPLIAKRCKATGRVLRHDGSVAATGERTPLDQQQLVPNKRKLRRNFLKWVKQCFINRGYRVEWWELKACDYGAPTIRNRLFLCARRDAYPIVLPSISHGHRDSLGVREGSLLPFRTTAECIDWSVPMLSIFADKDEAKAFAKRYKRKQPPKRPLEDSTCRRIARGIMRFVLTNPEPYLRVVDGGLITPHVTKFRTGSTGHEVTESLHTITCAGEDGSRQGGNPPLGIVAGQIMPITHQGEHRSSKPADSLMPTITTAKRGEVAVLGSCLVPRYSEREGQLPRCREVDSTGPVVVPDGNGAQLVGAFMSQHNAGYYDQRGGCGRNIEAPQGAVCAEGSPQSLVAINMVQSNHGDKPFYGAEDPSRTIVAGGTHHAVVASGLLKLGNAPADVDIEDPAHTILAGGLSHGLYGACLNTANNSRHPSFGADEPAHAIVADGARTNLVAVHAQREFSESTGSDLRDPVGACTGNGGGHTAVVASFISKYYGEGVGQPTDEALHVITTIDRFGLVTIKVETRRQVEGPSGFWIVECGEYVLTDIGMRMLTPRELYTAQGFRHGYVIDRGADGRIFTATEQVHMCGNSVSPVIPKALVRANCAHMIERYARVA